MASFKFYRGDIPGSAVASLGVVEHLNVVKDVCSCVIAGWVDLATNTFTLEQLEEALGHGVVVTVPATAHAGHEVVITQEVLLIVACELAALIRMHRDGLLGLTTPQGHHQRIEHQGGVDAAPH